MASATAGSASALLISAFSRSTMGCGVPAGAQKPWVVPVSKPVRPSSASVAVPGYSGDRLALPTASSRSLPDLMCGKAMPGSKE